MIRGMFFSPECMTQSQSPLSPPPLPDTLAADPAGQLAWTAAVAADDRKAVDITLLRVTDVCYLSDYFVVVTGFSRTQVRAIADEVEAQMEIQWQRYPLRTEGKSEGSWVLLDFGEVIVHVLLPTEREFYNLEAFWGHGDRLDFAPTVEA